MKLTGRNFLGVLVFIFFVNIHEGRAQNSVGIGTRQPNSNAALHIVSPNGNQGLLIPSLTTSQRESLNFVSSLSSNENGLLVFDLEESAFYYWMNDQWQPIISGDITQFLSGGEGISVSADGVITNIGDTDSTDDITTSTLAEGDLEGTFPNLNISESAVTLENLADESVNSDKIVDNSILPEDLNSPGGGKVLITTSGGTVFWENQTFFGVVNSLAQGAIFIGNSQNSPMEIDVAGEGAVLIGNGTTATSVAVTGDLSLSSTGNAQIQPNAVTANEIASGAVGTEEIADGQVNSVDIADSAISTAKLADNAVTTLKILDGAVGVGKIGAGAVNSNSIADGTIINDDISAMAAIAGTKIVPDFGAQKAYSAATVNTDAANTLTTKGYVDAVNTEELSGGNGITSFTYDGTSTATVGVNAGAGLGFDAGSALQVNSLGITNGMLATDAITSDKIAAATITNSDINSNAEIEGTKINPNFGVQNIGTTGDLSVANITLTGKATSAATDAGDPDNTLATKGYVDDAISSDRNLKTNIQPLDNSLESVLLLKPAQYNWRDPKKEGISYGLIAQELAKIYPEIVRERSDGYLGIDYYELIPILIKAIQEQQMQIQKLQSTQITETKSAEVEQDMQSLKDENQQLRQEIEMIKKSLGLTEKAVNGE